ncbi:MAG: ZIP family metal transporter [Candidatus Thermoplasmatota archaeon]
MTDLSMLWYIVLATLLVSLLSFLGALSLAISDRALKRILLLLVGFAAGGLIGGALFHLLPEALEAGGEGLHGTVETVFVAFAVGFMLFFVLEKLLWRHCHDRACPIHTFAYLNLGGDAVHNAVDGLVIAAAFMADFYLGLVTTVAVAMHEIPQELGDFGVLVYGGLEKKRALLLNFVTALTAVGGGICGFFLVPYVHGAMIFLLPFAAGGFMYIASADLIPELHKEADVRRSAVAFVSFVGGMALMWAARLLHHGA